MGQHFDRRLGPGEPVRRRPGIERGQGVLHGVASRPGAAQPQVRPCHLGGEDRGILAARGPAQALPERMAALHDGQPCAEAALVQQMVAQPE